MKRFLKHVYIVIIAVLLIISLPACGGKKESDSGSSENKASLSLEDKTPPEALAEEDSPFETPEEEDETPEKEEETLSEAPSPVLDNASPDAPEEDIEDQEPVLTCTVSITCASILDNLDDLADEKKDYVPEDGVLLSPYTISFKEGETAFDTLLYATRENNIHMEYVKNPMFNSAYVEGIGNIYEFDCGELSGWTYTVNGETKGVGASLYALSDGDVVEWIYTCDMGKDI